jgi:hypothetical protein
MSEPAQQQTNPPQLRPAADGGIDVNSLADLLEWFLNFDERTARIRHANTEEVFQWKQHSDAENGATIYPFENAEARFAVGVFQAVTENNSEPLLKLWITDVLAALHDARETKAELTETYRLDEDPEKFDLARSEKLTTNAEKRVYLTSCWLEALCTAEARFLGWVYQERYGMPFQPAG